MKKTRIREEAKKALDKINDYTFRIFSPCGVGTGWVLDYQIPEGNKYPTVWYIATNAHVIKSYRFSENPYKQELNISAQSTRALRNKWSRYHIKYDHLSLWDDATCDPVDWYGYFDISLSKSKSGERLQADKGMVKNHKIKEPKLFFVATNFLDENRELGVEKDNYRDFAVLEIEFTSEQYAREATENFADTYKVNSNNAINIFADALEDRYSLEDFEKLDENFYNLGYPSKFKGVKQKWAHNVNFEEKSAEAAKLSRDPHNWYYKKEEDRVRGFLDTQRMGTGYSDWAGKKRKRVGHFYMVREHKDHNLGGGSSGSIYTDKNGALIGVKSVREMSEKGGLHSFITPLRSKKINKGDKKNLVSPEYDLILGGVTGQKSSYRQQVEEYVIKKGKKTWWSSENWKHHSDSTKQLVK